MKLKGLPSGIFIMEVISIIKRFFIPYFRIPDCADFVSHGSRSLFTHIYDREIVATVICTSNFGGDRKPGWMLGQCVKNGAIPVKLDQLVSIES